MRLRCIIIDDEETGIETLRLLINKYLDDVKIVAECTQAREAIELIENYKPEIIFLDISMPEMNGFELLEQLSWKGFHLIFTTAHQEYALKALKLEAMDYLLKPVDPADLRYAVDKVRQQLDQEESAMTVINYGLLNSIQPQASSRLALNSKDGIEYIEPAEVIFFESRSNYTRTYLANGREILSPKTLGEFETLLCYARSDFMRVHNSFIINLQKVIRYIKDEESIVMAGSQKIPLSKSRKEHFFKWLHA